MCLTLMEHLTLNEDYIRELDSYTIGMGCVLDVGMGSFVTTVLKKGILL